MAYGTLEQRREARDAVAHPGRFEGESPMAVIIDDIVMDGFHDDVAFGQDWSEYRVGRYTLLADSSGFIGVTRHASPDAAQAVIDKTNDRIIRACPVCGAEGATALGTLGDLDHYRCRDCGTDFTSDDQGA